MNKIFWIAFPVVLLAAGCSGDKPDNKNADAPPTAPHFTTTTVEARPVEQIVRLPAMLAAYQEVSIFPKVNGYVKSVLVDVGSHVHQGQLLMVLEAPEMVQAVAEAKERYARAIADYTIDKENYQRLDEASRTPGAISPMELATDKAKAQADSSLANSEKANWQMHQVMMGYLQVTAPFTGVITIRNVHPGALVDATNKSVPMLELKEIDHLRLQVDIPETIAATLRNSDSLSFSLSALPGRRLTAKIARKSMNINAQYRTERVEADVYNHDEILSPGMYADVVFDSKGNRNALSVPANAVVTSNERKYVILVRDGKTAKVDVTTGNEGKGRVEIVGDVRAGEKVVAPANDEIGEGVAIR
ncbi:MAG TPA: efflux RND transporter periplasmic adaptor subunit [Puia sp.]|nr:efflux RND transporter periplasmic adaptor subunit [Puia sp.]